MKIKSMVIKNFKAIEELKVNFTSNKNGAENEIELDLMKLSSDEKSVIPYLNYIIGRNSIGKTSILNAIVFFARFFASEQEAKAKRILAWDLLIENKEAKLNNISAFVRTTNQIKLEEKIRKEIDGGKHKERLLEIKSNIYEREYKKVALTNKKPIEIKINFNQRKPFYLRLNYPVSKLNDSLSTFYEPVLFSSLETSNSKFTNKILDWARGTIKLWEFNSKISGRYYLPHGKFISRNINAVLEFLIKEFSETPKGLSQLNELIKLANPRFIEFVQSDKAAIGYSEKKAPLTKDVNTLSAGTIRFLWLLGLILMFAKQKAGVLLIDEIDSKIHKELANVIKIGLLEIAKKYNLQVIITLHNPLVLKEFVSNKQIISLDDDNAVISATKVSSKMKPKNSVVKKYENNEIAMFPEPRYADEMSRNFFSEW